MNNRFNAKLMINSAVFVLCSSSERLHAHFAANFNATHKYNYFESKKHYKKLCEYRVNSTAERINEKRKKKNKNE